MMNDSEPEIRQMAAFALGLIADPEAIPRLGAALRDPDATVRGRAAQALGAIGEASAAPEVAKMVEAAMPRGAQTIAIRGDDPGSPADPWMELRLGLLALGELGDAPTLQKVLTRSGAPRFDWWAATYVAAQKPTPALRSLLTAAARSNDPLSRTFAARGLGRLASRDDLPLLRTMVKDADPRVAVTALRAIGDLGDPAGVAALTSGLASTDPALRQVALEEIARFPVEPALRDQLVDNVAQTDAGVRGAALGALARGDIEQLALVLSGQDRDPVPEVRVALARSLGQGSGEFAAGLLFGLLKDPDPAVVAQALDSLRILRTSDAADTLIRSIDDPRPIVRAAAVRGLVALRRVGLAAQLIGAYRKALGEADLLTRAAALRGLAIDPSDEATAAIAEVTKSETSVGLWRAAASWLRQRRPGAIAAPLLVAPPYLDRRLAMAPFAPFAGRSLYTPRVFLKTTRGAVEIHLNIVEAPLACETFARLARRGYYDGQRLGPIRPGESVVFEAGAVPGEVSPRELGERPVGVGTVLALGMDDAPEATSHRLLVTLVPAPDLARTHTVLGWVASGLDVVANLRPGDVVETAQVWDGQ